MVEGVAKYSQKLFLVSQATFTMIKRCKMNSNSINLGYVLLHLTDKGDQEKNCYGEICSEKKLLRPILQKNDFPNDDTKNQPGRKKLGAFQYKKEDLL